MFCLNLIGAQGMKFLDYGLSWAWQNATSCIEIWTSLLFNKITPEGFPLPDCYDVLEILDHTNHLSFLVDTYVSIIIVVSLLLEIRSHN